MVHDIGTESVSDDDPAQSGGMMADLPPLLLGTYTPKIDAKDVWHCLRSSAANWAPAW